MEKILKGDGTTQTSAETVSFQVSFDRIQVKSEVKGYRVTILPFGEMSKQPLEFGWWREKFKQKFKSTWQGLHGKNEPEREQGKNYYTWGIKFDSVPKEKRFVISFGPRFPNMPSYIVSFFPEPKPWTLEEIQFILRQINESADKWLLQRVEVAIDSSSEFFHPTNVMTMLLAGEARKTTAYRPPEGKAKPGQFPGTFYIAPRGSTKGIRSYHKIEYDAYRTEIQLNPPFLKRHNLKHLEDLTSASWDELLKNEFTLHRVTNETFKILQDKIEKRLSKPNKETKQYLAKAKEQEENDPWVQSLKEQGLWDVESIPLSTRLRAGLLIYLRGKGLHAVLKEAKKYGVRNPVEIFEKHPILNEIFVKLKELKLN